MESIADDLPYNSYGTGQMMLPQFLEMVKVSRAGEFHPHALPELDVNLSAHPAPIHERDPLAPIPQ